jgi:hypothetical protein
MSRMGLIMRRRRGTTGKQQNLEIRAFLTAESMVERYGCDKALLLAQTYGLEAHSDAEHAYWRALIEQLRRTKSRCEAPSRPDRPAREKI